MSPSEQEWILFVAVALCVTAVILSVAMLVLL